MDYSFGLKSAQDALTCIKEKRYADVSKDISGIHPDELTVIVDYLALSLDEKQIQEWADTASEQNLALLVLGVYYNHQAWLVRTHQRADNVSDNEALDFFELNLLSLTSLKKVKETSIFFGETCSRLIRVCMGQNDHESVDTYFQKCLETNRDSVWPYLHYCEAIEPKWGGSIEKVKALNSSLPDNRSIRHIITLKVLLDSLQNEENLFGGTLSELHDKAADLLHQIDEDVTVKPITSINRYILFNYMFSVSAEVKNNKLMLKYYKLMKGYFTLHPSGVVV